MQEIKMQNVFLVKFTLDFKLEKPFYFWYAICANLFVAEVDKLTLSRAEAAGLRIFSYDDFFTVRWDFSRVSVWDAENLTHFFGYNYSAQLINVSYNTFGFHWFPFFLVGSGTPLYSCEMALLRRWIACKPECKKTQCLQGLFYHNNVEMSRFST